MTRGLPDMVVLEVRERVYQLADERHYLRQGRVENGRFMEELLRDPKVGGVIGEYKDEGDIRHYIKDAILNRYSKERHQQIYEECDIPAVISETIHDAYEIAGDSESAIFGSRECPEVYCAVGYGTVDKYETAIKRALRRIESLEKEAQESDVRIAVVCTTPKGKLPIGDLEEIRHSLKRLNVDFYWLAF